MLKRLALVGVAVFFLGAIVGCEESPQQKHFWRLYNQCYENLKATGRVSRATVRRCESEAREMSGYADPWKSSVEQQKTR